MNVGDNTLTLGLVVFSLATAALIDLHRVETGSITVYTTPALRDVLEKGIQPIWQRDGELRIEPVYVAAGAQYNRLRMSGAKPEADIFLHASPLFLEKGHDEGYMVGITPNLTRELNDTYRSNGTRVDGHAWYAWAWSPLVEVYAPSLGQAPDLANASLKYGLAHPTLSNNGIYTVLFLEHVSPAAGEHARSQTVVQPVNARTNINGVADGSFHVTLGYEAVAKFYQAQGAKIAFEAPLIEGKRVSTPVLFCVALVDGPHRAQAERFVDLLFTNETQGILSQYHFRSVYNITPPPSDLPADLDMVEFKWEDWETIEEILPLYEVIPNRD